MFSQVSVLVLLCASVHSQRNIQSMTLNSDGTSNFALRQSLFGNGRGFVSGLASSSSSGALSRGLAFDNINGNGFSVTHTKIPDFGSQLTGAGRLNLLRNNNHNLDANAFFTRNMPKIPDVPNFNTFGGNLDYMYRNKIGANLGIARTPYLQRTDYSALGKLNLFNSKSSSVDLNAGFSKSVSPFMSKQSWQPSAGLTFSKFF